MSIKPEKAYKNLNFLNSPPARPIRILCEYEEPRQRFQQLGIHDTIVFFGSARAKSAEETDAAVAAAQAKLAAGEEGAAAALAKAQAGLRMSRYYEQARELANRLTRWSMYRDGRRRYTVCTGGGPGIMEAANRGASEVEGGRSIGLGISLPFEPGVNEYTTKELAFEFHYFFTRKLWFAYLMKAMVVFPGGFGTFDELFELLTLIQTGKMRKSVPLLLFGTEYWDRVVDLHAMAEFGTISLPDLDLLHRTDSVDEAFEYLTSHLSDAEGRMRAG
jgi:uncharacterized protein (TIGR00730 family)